MNPALTRRPLSPLLFVAGLALTLAPPARADDNRWRFRLVVSYTDVGGHDPHVLTVTGSQTAGPQNLETQSDIGRTLGAEYDRGGKWSYGAEFFFFTGAQELANRTASAEAGGAAVSFALTEREFTSFGPGAVVFFEQLGDTDMNAWTFDIYALRRLSEADDRAWHLLLGVRNADFDNDNHFVAGIVDVAGSRVDASSNYSRMIGPMAGLVHERDLGRQQLAFSLTASVVSGDAELSSALSDFLGPFTDGSENIVASRMFQVPDSVTIPIADLRGEWRYRPGGRFDYVVGLHFSRWGDVAVPPGVRPTGTLETLYESSITFSSLMFGVEFGF